MRSIIDTIDLSTTELEELCKTALDIIARPAAYADACRGKKLATLFLNDTPLTQITLHPRLGKQQYKGAIDIKSFEKFYSECRHPLVYNGDITSVSQICEMERRYPKLAGIMIGRGLLAQPSLAAEYKARKADITEKEFTDKLLQMHEIIFEYACKAYQGDSQILSHVQSFWEYIEPNIPKKIFKKIKKAGKLNEYQEAIIEMGALS